MTAHTSKRFNANLESIRSRFLAMGSMVQAMVQDAIDALSQGDLTLVDRVRAREKDVNRYEVEIDQRISYILARHQPTAVDLRMVLAVSKMLTDMERSGDEAEKIATVARHIHEADMRVVPSVDLRHMANGVLTMLGQALDAFARLDALQAAQVVRGDKEVDKEWKAALRQFISFMIEDPRTISSSIDLIFIARALERIGDHAKNMAERVIYMVRGADVRHTGVKNAERQARGEVENDEVEEESQGTST
jgi:phosphate transport system protein